jgi:hypothetical protein
MDISSICIPKSFPRSIRRSLKERVAMRLHQRTLAGKLECISNTYPALAVLIRRPDDEGVVSGNASLYDDLLIAQGYIIQFLPGQSGRIVVHERGLRIFWVVHEHVMILMAAVHEPRTPLASQDKCVRRLMRRLAKLVGDQPVQSTTTV